MPRIMSSRQNKLGNKMSFEYLIPDSSYILKSSQFGWQVAPIKYCLEIQLSVVALCFYKRFSRRATFGGQTEFKSVFWMH